MTKSFLDSVCEGIGDAVTDIREKLVEEAWFGRTASNSYQPPKDYTKGIEAPEHIKKEREQEQDDREYER